MQGLALQGDHFLSGLGSKSDSCAKYRDVIIINKNLENMSISYELNAAINESVLLQHPKSTSPV